MGQAQEEGETDCPLTRKPGAGLMPGLLRDHDLSSKQTLT